MTIELPQIRIRKLNYAFVRIETDMDIALEISSSLTFEVPGAKHTPAFKRGQWDGKIRLFNLGSRTIPAGLYQKVIEFAQSRDYTYSIIDDSKDTGYLPAGYKTPGIDFDTISDYMESLNIYAHGDKLEIRDYQVNGVTIALRDRQAILHSSVGSGKSLMIYTIFRYLTEELDLRALLIVPTVGLTTQMESDFREYSSKNGYDVDSNMHLISAGITKNTKKPIVISTFQSLKEQTPEWFNSFGLIMTDEGHKIQSKSFQDIYGKAVDVPFRLACTGTISDTKCDILQMIGLTGPVYEVALAKDLIAAKQLVPLKIKSIVLEYPQDICKAFKGVDYEDEIKWIITNPKRNNFIKKLATNCQGTTLIFFRFIEHGQLLFDLIKESVGHARKVYLVNGDVDKDDRELIRKSANDNDAIIICSYGVFSAGINLPSVENMIVGHPIKSKITFLQSIGRGLRLKTGKTHCKLYDIGDNLTYKSKVNYTFNHFGERIKLLTAEGFDLDIVNIPF